MGLSHHPTAQALRDTTYLDNMDINTAALSTHEPRLIDDVRKNTANIFIFSNDQFKRRILSSSFTSIS